MLKLAPILMALIYGLVYFKFSVWRTKAELDQNSVPLAHPALAAELPKLARALDIPRVNVNVLQNDVVNGLAAPDGRIFITSGFLRKMDAGDFTPTELVSVIAHELGHVALGHSRRRMIDFSTQNAIRTALAMVLARFIPGVGPMIAGAMTSMLAARLSRNDEFEADAYASALMVKAGFGTAPQKSMFEKLAKHSGNRPGGFAWLASHPKTDDRIKAIEVNEAKWDVS